MATHCGGIGDTSWNDPQDNGSKDNIDNDRQDNIDNDSQDNYQDNFHELDYDAPHHPAGVQQLTHQIEQLRQMIEASDNDPMNAIHDLEQRLNQLTIVLCTPTELIG